MFDNFDAIIAEKLCLLMTLYCARGHKLSTATNTCQRCMYNNAVHLIETSAVLTFVSRLSAALALR